MEKIICAAVFINDIIFRGHRHCHAIQAMNDRLSYLMSRKEISALDVKQGFITSELRFVEREEAMDIAKKAGQIDEIKSEGSTELFSEDLY